METIRELLNRIIGDYTVAETAGGIPQLDVPWIGACALFLIVVYCVLTIVRSMLAKL